MQKLQINQINGGRVLTLDYCKRCGGVWFDKDEVKLSQQIKSSKVRQHLLQKPRKWMIHCHGCNAPMDRNLENCDRCGWRNQISCPVCEQKLQRKQHNSLILDICHSCQGVWFDQIELISLWNQLRPETQTSSGHQTAHIEASAQPTQQGQEPNYNQVNIIGETIGQTIVEGSVEGGLDIVTQGGADLAQYVVQMAGHTVEGSAQALSSTPEIAGGVVESLAEVTGTALESVGELPELAISIIEVTGEVAAGMTEMLADVIAGLFS